MFTLIFNRKTNLCMSSLYPIALKIGIKKLTKGIKSNSEKTLSSRTREFLINSFPKVKDLLNNFLQHLKSGFKNYPQTNLHVHIQEGNKKGIGSSRATDKVAKLMNLMCHLTRNAKYVGSHLRAIEA